MKFSDYSWKYVDGTQAELNELRLYDCAMNYLETVRIIAERIFNERVSDEVEMRYVQAKSTSGQL